jgi:hypothetical protein
VKELESVIVVSGVAKDEKQAEAGRRAVIKALEDCLRAMEEAEKKAAKAKEAKER